MVKQGRRQQVAQSEAHLTTGLLQPVKPQEQENWSRESDKNSALHESRFQSNLATVPVQRKAGIPKKITEEETKHPNNTGLPDNLKAGLEQLSGIDMSDVQVHYNSAKPAQLNALAYTQGTEIHVGPGQENHLPHEGWHVAQQKQGLVNLETSTKGGFSINQNSSLEKEADMMGDKVKKLQGIKPITSIPVRRINHFEAVLQAKWLEKDGTAMWDEAIDGVTWFAKGPQRVWFHIVDPSAIVLGSYEQYKKLEGVEKTFSEWQHLSASDLSIAENINSPMQREDVLAEASDSDEAAVNEVIKVKAFVAEKSNEASEKQQDQSPSVVEKLEEADKEVDSNKNKQQAQGISEEEEEEAHEDEQQAQKSAEAEINVNDNQGDNEAEKNVQDKVELLHEKSQDLPVSQDIHPKIASIREESIDIAQNDNEDPSKAEADALVVKTNNLILQVEARERAQQENLSQSQEPDLHPVVQDVAQNSNTIDRYISGDLLAQLNRVEQDTAKQGIITIADLEILAEIIDKLPEGEYEISKPFLVLDKISADIAEGTLPIVAIKDKTDKVSAANAPTSKMDMLEQVLGTASDVTSLSGQFGTGFTENSGVSNAPGNNLVQEFFELHKQLFEPNNTPSDAEIEDNRNAFQKFMADRLAVQDSEKAAKTSGFSDSVGGTAEYFSAMIAYKALLDERFGPEWKKKNIGEKAQWYAQLGDNVSSQFAAAYKATAGVMDASLIAQDKTATNIFTGKKLIHGITKEQNAGTSSVKFVGDIGGVASGGFSTITESIGAINSVVKWGKSSRNFNRETAGKILLVGGKITKSAATTVRDSFRLALQTGAVDAAAASVAGVVATSAGVAVGALTAIRAGYLLNKYKTRLAEIQKVRNRQDTSEEKAETILKIEGVLRKKINRAWVNLAASAATVVSGALALSGVGAIASIALGALVGSSKLIHTAFKGFRQWRRNVQARKRLETYENWKKRQEAKMALTNDPKKRAKYKSILKTTMKSGFATKQAHAGESFKEWKKRQNWATIKVTPDWDKATGAKQIDNLSVVKAMKEYQDQELYKALGLKMDEVLGKDNHDAIVLEKLKSRG